MFKNINQLLELRSLELKSLEERFQKLSSYEHFVYYKKIKEIQKSISQQELELEIFMNDMNAFFQFYNKDYYLKLEKNTISIYYRLSTLISFSFESQKFNIYSNSYNNLSEFILLSTIFEEKINQNKHVFQKYNTLIFEDISHIHKFLSYKENEDKMKRNAFLKKYLHIHFKKHKTLNPIDKSKSQVCYRFIIENDFCYFENVSLYSTLIGHVLTDHSYIFINYEKHTRVTDISDLNFLPKFKDKKLDLNLFYDFVTSRNKIENF